MHLPCSNLVDVPADSPNRLLFRIYSWRRSFLTGSVPGVSSMRPCRWTMGRFDTANEINAEAVIFLLCDCVGMLSSKIVVGLLSVQTALQLEGRSLQSGGQGDRQGSAGRFRTVDHTWQDYSRRLAPARRRRLACLAAADLLTRSFARIGWFHQLFLGVLLLAAETAAGARHHNDGHASNAEQQVHRGWVVVVVLHQRGHCSSSNWSPIKFCLFGNKSTSATLIELSNRSLGIDIANRSTQQTHTTGTSTRLRTLVICSLAGNPIKT